MAFFCCYCGCKVNNNWLFCPKCGKSLPKIENKTSKKQIADSNEQNSLEKTNLIRNVDVNAFELRLREYRALKSSEEHRYPLCVFEDNALYQLLNARNRIIVKEDLLKVKYWGEYRIKKYGDDIVGILEELDRNYIFKK